MTRRAYIQTFGPIIQKVCKGTGLFPSVMMAQGLIETSRKQKDGSYSPDENNPLFKVHNHFGIKDQPNDEWTAKNILIRTWEIIKGKKVSLPDTFREYNSVEEGFQDRVNFLKKNSRYTKAKVFTAPTPYEQAIRLKFAGYATDPDYAQTIQSLIHTYQLQTLD